MQQADSALFQQLGHLSHVNRNKSFPDMLEHAYGYKLVEFTAKLTVIHQLHLDTVAKAQLLYPPARMSMLVLRNRDARPLYAVTVRRVHEHPSPTAPDVDQRVLMAEHEFAGNVVV